MEPLTVGSIFGLLLTAVAIPAGLHFLNLRLTDRNDQRRELRSKRVELMERLSRIVWKWRYAAKQVAYYGAEAVDHPERHQQAGELYETAVWDHFTELQAIRSACMLQFPPEAAKGVWDLYSYLKDDLDVALTDIMEETDPHARQKRAASLSERFTREVTGKIDTYLEIISAAMRKAA
jgi:hypothetical protein